MYYIEGLKVHNALHQGTKSTNDIQLVQKS